VTTNVADAVALVEVLADQLETHCGGTDDAAIEAVGAFGFLAWCLVARLAGVDPPTPATRSCVLHLLCLRQRNADPFAGGLRVVSS
jgi:hypothetical protein